MARKMKVYAAEIDGLNDWIVAAPNRPAALEAFGMHQDLFAQGMAREEKAAEAVEQALKAPCTPLHRPKGSSEAFVPATGATDWSAAVPKEARSKPKKPDRKAVDRAEARLAEVEDRHRQSLEEFKDEHARLDEREADEARAYAGQKAKAEAALDDARDAFRRSGGR